MNLKKMMGTVLGALVLAFGAQAATGESWKSAATLSAGNTKNVKLVKERNLLWETGDDPSDKYFDTGAYYFKITGKRGKAYTVTVALNSSDASIDAGIEDISMYNWSKEVNAPWWESDIGDETLRFILSEDMWDLGDGTSEDPGHDKTVTYYLYIQGDIGTSVKVAMVNGVEAYKSYNVTFDANGGTVKETLREVSKDAAVGSLPKGTRKGYTLKGWYTKASGGTKITKNTKVTKKVTYYAHWTGITYKIKFYKNGGTGTMKTLSATYGKKVALTANAFKLKNYSFVGWATNKTDAVATYANKATVKNLSATDGETVKLYAVWERKTYTVKFNANGGTGKMSKLTINCGDTVELTANAFVREGYKFSGWATTKDGKVAYKNGVQVTDIAKSGKTVTLYAVWKKVK